WRHPRSASSPLRPVAVWTCWSASSSRSLARTSSPRGSSGSSPTTGGREPELESVVGRPAPFEVKVVRLPEPSGPGPARNASLEVAEGEIIYLSDDDCSPGPSTLGEHAAAVAGGDVVSLGGLRFEPEDGKETTWLARRANWWNVNGANTAVRADVLRDVGGFDETLKGYGVED